MLRTNTWNLHIKTNHPEVSNELPAIKGTVENPSYVAHSLPGKNGNLAGNLVFVGQPIEGRKSSLHVFVESPALNPTITTAFFARRPTHAQVVWRAVEDVQASYDRDADMLYVSKNGPSHAVSEENEKGLLLRYTMDTDTPCGVTVISFRSSWQLHQDELAQDVSAFLDIPFARVRSLLAGALV